MTASMTPVRVTERYRSLRGRMEVWAAESADGTYTYRRIEDTGTPWRVEHVPTHTDCGLFGSLPAARRATADGSALASAAAAAGSASQARSGPSEGCARCA